VTTGTNDVSATKPVRTRKVIQASCVKHGGSRGFTNVVVTKRGGEIEIVKVDCPPGTISV
jgi:hypothetical protein